MSSSSIQWTELFTGRNRVYVQLVFWVFVFWMYIILKEYPASFTGVSLFGIVLQETLELAIPCYTQNLLVLPLFRRRKMVPAIAAYLLQLVLLIWLLPYGLNAVGRFFSALFHSAPLPDWRNEHIGFSMVAFTLVASAFRLALDRLMMEKEKKEQELRQLKAQLNPHFLFNTLNNLYGLAVVKSEKLPTLMLKLSDLLRYSLYETGQDLVSLQKELTYIGDYIALEKIRLDAATEIRFETEGNVNGQLISPLLLMSFIENAFKHFSSPRNVPACIEILISVTGDALRMTVRNSLDPALYLRPAKESRKGGIGMANAKDRLQLLYPQNHSLTISHVPESYLADLKIRLNR